jgi:acyl carrier protein
VRDKVDKAFYDAFGIPQTLDRSSLVYNSSPGWDSVGHMALVAALEQEFDCMLDMNDILDMSSYDKVVEIMAKYASKP